MLVEELFSFEIFVGGYHDVIQIAIGDFEVVEVTDVALGGNLRAHSDISDSGQLAFLHETELLRVVFAPSQGPALLLFELEDTASLRINLKNVKDSSDIDQAEPCAVTVDSNDEG